jgi:hypothetical protein
MRANGKKYKIEARLKGTMTDHYLSDQWSFRIELDGDYAIWGMQKFSIQAPVTRSYLYQWMANELYRYHGGVAIRQDMIDVYVNGEYKGVYLLEEFFEKRINKHIYIIIKLKGQRIKDMKGNRRCEDKDRTIAYDMLIGSQIAYIGFVKKRIINTNIQHELVS